MYKYLFTLIVYNIISLTALAADYNTYLKIHDSGIGNAQRLWIISDEPKNSIVLIGVRYQSFGIFTLNIYDVDEKDQPTNLLYTVVDNAGPFEVMVKIPQIHKGRYKIEILAPKTDRWQILVKIPLSKAP